MSPDEIPVLYTTISIAVVLLLSLPWLWKLRQLAMQSNPRTYDVLQNTIQQLSERLDTVEVLRQAEHDTVIAYSTEMGRQGILLERWKAYARLQNDRLEAAGIKDIPPPPEEFNGTPEYRYYRPIGIHEPSRLRNHLIMAFNIEELDSLAFDLGLSAHMSGNTLSERAEHLVAVAQRRGMIARLLAAARQQRPNGGF